MALGGLCLLVSKSVAAEAPSVWRVCLADWSLPPYLYNEPGRQGAVDILLTEAGHEVGLNVLILRLPAKRCTLMLLADEVDVSVATVTPGNLQRFSFPMHQGEVDVQRRLATVNLVWVKRAGSPLDWDGQRLKGAERPADVKVGIRLGFPALRDELQAMGLSVDATALQVTQLFSKLSRSRIDLAVVVQQEVAGALADPSLDRLVVLPKAMRAIDFYAVARPGLAPDMQARVESWWTAIGRRRDAVLPPSSPPR